MSIPGVGDVMAAIFGAAPEPEPEPDQIMFGPCDRPESEPEAEVEF